MLTYPRTHRDECIPYAWLRDVAPDLTLDPLELGTVRDDHLRSAVGEGVEDDYIERLMRTSLGMGERGTRRFWLPQTWRLLLDRFPGGCSDILVDRAPLNEVTGITYVDPDGVTQTFGGSPLAYEVENPSVETNAYARIRLAYGESWPSTRGQRRAVTITVVLGYPTVDGSVAIPDDLLHGRLLVIGELYKQRSESVHAFNQNPAILRAQALWQAWRVY